MLLHSSIARLASLSSLLPALQVVHDRASERELADDPAFVSCPLAAFLLEARRLRVLSSGNKRYRHAGGAQGKVRPVCLISSPCRAKFHVPSDDCCICMLCLFLSFASIVAMLDSPRQVKCVCICTVALSLFLSCSGSSLFSLAISPHVQLEYARAMSL